MIKVGNMLPEAINSCESQEPLRVNFPGIPEKASRDNLAKLHHNSLETEL